MASRTRLAALMIAALGLWPTGGRAGAPEETLVAVFRDSCLAHLAAPRALAGAFATSGVPTLPPEKARAILGADGGTVWRLERPQGPVAVALTDRTVCMVVGVGTDPDALISAFEASVRQLRRDEKRTDQTVQLSYAVTVPGGPGQPDVHALVEIRSLTGNGETVLRLSAIPEALLFGTAAAVRWP